MPFQATHFRTAWLCLAAVTSTCSSLHSISEEPREPVRRALEKSSNWDLCAKPVLNASSLLDGAKYVSTIPKIIHQTYRDRELPQRFQHYQTGWKTIFSAERGWTYNLWDDAANRQLIKEHYPWFLDTYDGYDEKIKQVDAVRPFYLHRYGGIYADLDVEVLRDPSPLFAGDNDLVLFYQVIPRAKLPRSGCHYTRSIADVPHDGRAGPIPNALMASVPGHPFWLYYAEKMMKSPKEDVFWATGPSLLTTALQEYQQQDPSAKVAVFSTKYWSPFRWNNPLCESTSECTEKFPEAFLMSHWMGSWDKRRSKKNL